MNLKNGDKVRIRKDLKEGCGLYGRDSIVNEDMKELAGNIVVVEQVFDVDYEYDFKIEGYRWAWTYEMIESLNTTTDIDKFGKLIFSNNVTILKNGSEKTIVRSTKGDEYNPEFGFLMAYFQQTTGMSKTQVSKFMKGVKEEYIKQSTKATKKKLKKEAKRTQ